MKNGICPKCKSDEVYFRESSIISNRTEIRISGLSYAYPSIYVCAKCGYIERYIGNSRKLDQVSTNWTKVAA